ncbi:hypothetical protein DUI87_26960 [Hirundo rustica rustica]|uniref:Cadherin domain-containing protein n=1 Tax=Hirundo rustica rustica TaxID=333673 RepID=A0A3M0J6C2_HIRRU|nr:hypothetical protein DUI87_26960 [Hirundo rustica rustica]
MGERRCAAVRVLVLQAAWALAGGQVRYSVPEEAEAGTVVGRLAQDLGLEAGEAEARRLRLVAQGRRASVELSGASGALLLSSRLDREQLCAKSAPCALRLEVLLERPLRVFHVELEVTDINDNAPVFPATRKTSASRNRPLCPGLVSRWRGPRMRISERTRSSPTHSAPASISLWIYKNRMTEILNLNSF